MHIETNRLIIRPFTETDMDIIYALVYAGEAVREAWSGYKGSLQEFRARFMIDPLWQLDDVFGFLALLRKEAWLNVN